jgi:hypothetical protein
MIIYPCWFPNYENNKYVPADYKIANIIKYLWSKKIIAGGWDQPKYIINKINNKGFITLKSKTDNQKDTIEELIKMFGEDNRLYKESIIRTIKRSKRSRCKK